MSSINPNNINGSYPVAGQDNDSQGFRDNFTNVKNNLTFAKTEIEDLQQNAILKGALAGTTLDNNLNNAILKGAQMLKSTQTINDLDALSGAVTVDWNDAHFQILETSGNVTLSFDNWPTSGFYTSIRLQVTPGSTAHKVTLPSEVLNGLGMLANANVVTKTISFSSTAVHVYEFTTYDNGSTITVIPLVQTA